MKKLILSSFAIAAFVFISNSASAQDLTSTLGVKINSVVEFTKTTDDIGTGLEFTNSADLTGGKETAAGVVQLNYKSNKATYVSIKASDFVSAGNNLLTMPASIMQFKTTGGTFAPFAAANTAYNLSGTSLVGNAKGDANINVTYKVTPGLSYDPATDYSSTITYTITAL